jgi:hypothetical protein
MSHRDATADAAPPRTFFVTAIGCLGIGFGLLTLLVAAAAAYGFNVLFGGPELDADLATMAANPHVPAFNGWLLTHLSVLFYAAVAFGLAVVVLSIALLRRRNWGRLGILATLWLGVATNVAGAVAVLLLLQAFPEDAAGELVAAGVDFQRVMYGAMAMVVGGGMVVVSLHAWIIRRLTGDEARGEFDVD